MIKKEDKKDLDDLIHMLVDCLEGFKDLGYTYSYDFNYDTEEIESQVDNPNGSKPYVKIVGETIYITLNKDSKII